ncbi:ATP-binding protein [Actinoplanes subtropicus]|uniref:ATP-binding protein n=1 Tax=Actinoplanes subtropicus TaxID=543632 RepID=UPI0004C2DB22|nr:ATP-binding protein [Actinoplanes subtropicus]
MTGPLAWTVGEAAGLALVTVRGRLDLGGTPGFRTALLKCLAEQPEAVLVDLSEMELVEDTALALFTAVARQAARWPGTPILLCGPSPQVTELLEGGRYGKVAIRSGVAEARREVASGAVVTPSLSDQLLPIAGAVRHARDVVTEACLAWELPELVGPASLVASELTANAVEHAGTMMTVRITRRTRYVHVAVRDGSTDPPLLNRSAGLTERGRGLLLVDAIARHWGWLPTGDGKVVWASLRE